MNEGVDPAIVAVRFTTYLLAILVFGATVYRGVIDPANDHSRDVMGGPLPPAALSVSALAYLLLLEREAVGASGWPQIDLAAELAASTGFGRALASTAVTAAVLAALAWRDWRRLRLGLGGIALGALAFVGHAADGEGLAGDARIATMAVHLLAIGAWLGALPALWSAVRRKGPTAHATLRRFGHLGAVAVTLMLLTGAGSLAFVIFGARTPLGAAYLQVLALKLTLVAGLLALAAVNRFRLTPEVARDLERGLAALRRTIMVEQALGVAAIAAVAWLGQLDPSM